MIKRTDPIGLPLYDAAMTACFDYADECVRILDHLDEIEDKEKQLQVCAQISIGMAEAEKFVITMSVRGASAGGRLLRRCLRDGTDLSECG